MYEGQTVWIQNNEYTSSDSELDDDDEEEDDAKDFLAFVFSSLLEDDSSLDDSSDELAAVIYVYEHLLVFWLRSCLARTTHLVDNMISYFCFFPVFSVYCLPSSGLFSRLSFLLSRLLLPRLRIRTRILSCLNCFLSVFQNQMMILDHLWSIRNGIPVFDLLIH